MSLYRIKQFYWATEAIIKKVDYKYANEFLDDKERVLFNKLTKGDKHHSIRVCKEAIKTLNTKLDYNKRLDINKVAKAALLHDIGKMEHGLNAVEKSLVVILNKITNGKLKKYDNIKLVAIYYNNPETGDNILRKTNKYDKDFLEAIKYHHSNNNFENNDLLKILKESDNKS